MICILQGDKGRASLLSLIFFIFLQFTGKIGQILYCPSPFGVITSPPHVGNPGSATDYYRLKIHNALDLSAELEITLKKNVDLDQKEATD